MYLGGNILNRRGYGFRPPKYPIRFCLVLRGAAPSHIGSSPALSTFSPRLVLRRSYNFEWRPSAPLRSRLGKALSGTRRLRCDGALALAFRLHGLELLLELRMALKALRLRQIMLLAPVAFALEALDERRIASRAN